MNNYPTSDTQFLARCLIAVREGDTLSSADAHRLGQLAAFGYSREYDTTTTMPEERRDHIARPELRPATHVEG